MITREEILAVALCFVDGTLTDGEREALSVLCGAAAENWEQRLRDEADPEDFRGLFCLACAYTALGNFHGGMAGGASHSESYRLGELSVTRGNSSGAAATDRKGMLEQAEALMAPFTADLGFEFLEVEG